MVFVNSKLNVGAYLLCLFRSTIGDGGLNFREKVTQRHFRKTHWDDFMSLRNKISNEWTASVRSSEWERVPLTEAVHLVALFTKELARSCELGHYMTCTGCRYFHKIAGNLLRSDVNHSSPVPVLTPSAKAPKQKNTQRCFFEIST